MVLAEVVERLELRRVAVERLGSLQIEHDREPAVALRLVDVRDPGSEQKALGPRGDAAAERVEEVERVGPRRRVHPDVDRDEIDACAAIQIEFLDRVRVGTQRQAAVLVPHERLGVECGCNVGHRATSSRS